MMSDGRAEEKRETHTTGILMGSEVDEGSEE
jgi:hypothetical protein